MTLTTFDSKTYTRRCHLVSAVVCLVLIGAQGFALFDRIHAARGECRGVLDSQRQLMQQEPVLTARAKSLDNRVRELKSQRSHLRGRIPDSPGERVLIERLAADCERQQMTVIEFRPPEIRRCGTLECTRISLTATCSWQGLCTFLASCNTPHTIRSVEDCQVTVSEGAGEEIIVRLLIADWSSLTTQVTQSAPEVVR